ncbi:TetR/AcrR family transcriptional regulator [Slackia heliotrinireducens]|uniref:TetR/AcrR family transcriptional regulator n=1 Tax=Slackia heliotrinireducens TaxID=84110 RepID=UPI003315AF03
MARPRNMELYGTVKREAYRQLLSRGYQETTYQSIASGCGVTRVAVQNYFPSKLDLALAFFDDLLSALHRAILDEGIHQENEFDFMYCIGQGFFAFLLKDEGSRRLLLDLTSSRELTSQILLFEYRWGEDFITEQRTVSQEKFQNDTIVSMGGFYELLYRCLKDDKPFDLAVHLGRVVRTIMHDYGYGYEEAKAFVAAHAMIEDEKSRVVQVVSEGL